MNWELFWAALGSLSTMVACIIAIFQPTFQKIITKKKISLLRNLFISAKIYCKAYYKNAHISY